MPCFLNGNVFRRYDRRIMVMNKDLRAHLKGQERGEAWQRRIGGGKINRPLLFKTAGKEEEAVDPPDAGSPDRVTPAWEKRFGG